MKFQTELSTWTTTKLRQACTDIIEFKNTAILNDGPVREFAVLIRTELDNAPFDCLSLAQSMIQDEAMKRFAAITEALNINA